VTPEERARAVVAYFPAIPERIRREVESIIARAIRRAVAQELTGLAQRADMEAIRADGRGRQAKGQDISALQTHRWWEEKFNAVRQAILSRKSRSEGAKPRVEEETRNAKAARGSAATTPRLVRTRMLKPGDVVTVHPCAGAYTELPKVCRQKPGRRLFPPIVERWSSPITWENSSRCSCPDAMRHLVERSVD
jgi:hypothetical protein